TRDRGRTCVLADGGFARGAALLPGLARRRAGRADDDRSTPEGAAARVRTGGVPRQAGCRGHLLLRRAGRGRRAGRASAEGVRLADHRPLRAEAVPRAPVDVRPELPPPPLVL